MGCSKLCNGDPLGNAGVTFWLAQFSITKGMHKNRFCVPLPATCKPLEKGLGQEMNRSLQSIHIWETHGVYINSRDTLQYACSLLENDGVSKCHTHFLVQMRGIHK